MAAEYSYTDDGLLATATCGGTTTLTNTWNAMGYRVGLAVGSESYSFTYNPVAAVPAVIVESGGGKTYYYVRDPNGVLIARCEASSPDDYQYYHYDELGSTRLLTDENGDVTDEYAYDAYGATISHVGPTQDNPYQWVGSLGYYTHHQAPEFRLIQLGFRFYDPETGRFTQQDPIGDGLNWYEYAGSNPIGAVDPWGLNVYEDWRSGRLGSRIPILGDWAAQAGTDWGNAESGSGSWGRAAYTTGRVAVGTAAAGVGIYFGGRFLIGGGARAAAGRAASWLGPRLTSIAAAYTAGRQASVAVLGRYDDYLKLAQRLGASALNVPNWTRVANLAYMIGLRLSNATIVFSNNPGRVTPSNPSNFAWELKIMELLRMSGTYCKPCE